MSEAPPYGKVEPLPGTPTFGAPLRRPLSIVTFGNSVAVLQIPARRHRGEGTYSEVLADHVNAAGIPAVAHTSARWFDFIDDGMKQYQERVRDQLPDVVIVQYGLNEAQPWLVPIWLVRHLLVKHQAVTRVARLYRRTLATWLWDSVRAYRRTASGLVGTRTWQMTPKRFAGQLTRLIRNIRIEQRPLVLVLDLNPPGGILLHFLKGQARRHEIFSRVMADVVASFDDPDIRLVDTHAIVARLGIDQALPDGMHYSPEAHRLLGEALTAEVLGWVAERQRG